MTQAVTLAQLGGADTTLPFRNRIINGDMTIDQRNAGASVTANDSVWTVDRFQYAMAQSSKGSSVQSSVAPAGFRNSLLFTSSSAYALGAGEIFCLRQHIEGYNTADLDWGTATAKTVTLSFWVRSSLTGTFGGGILNSAQNRSYPFSYIINSANTWEQKSIVIPGDTTGTWLTTNGRGMSVFWSLGTGSNLATTPGAWVAGSYYSSTTNTSVVGTNGATWYVTGVQLETGTVATPFERRPYGTELALCQRYFQQLPSSRSGSTLVIANNMVNSTDRIPLPVLPVLMRTSPTIVSYRSNGTTSGETTEFSSATNRVITSIPNIDACGGGYLQSSTAFTNPACLNLTYSAEL